MKSFKRFAPLVCAALAVFACNLTAFAQPTIQLQPFLSGLSSPVYVTNAKDGSNRMFVVEQGGSIKVVQPNSTAPTVFLNISNKIVAGGEQGLLGLAFHPQFALNRKFYVNYTRSGDGATVIAEYLATAADRNVADPNSERILLVIPQPFSNHNGGMIEFDKAGFLVIGMGDGGSGNDPGNRAQNRSQLLGKMVRIGVDVPAGSSEQYTIPPDNPFAVSGGGSVRCPNGSAASGLTCAEIYAIGMRNPFRWSFDRKTGQLYAGDVGQGALEEIDIITNGGNYGWRVYEGTQCTNLDASLCTPANYTAPVYEYFNSGSPRCSVTGGYVYRGKRGTLPDGTYVFSDYCTGEIMIQGAQPRTPTVLLDSPRNVASFGEDETGELYVVGLGGTIEKIVNPNATTPRNAVADFDGDLRTDLAVLRLSETTWYLRDSAAGIYSQAFRGVQWGVASDVPTPGDFDGDGKTDVAVFRSGTWFVLNSSNNSVTTFQWGVANDLPVAGDYDGDKRSDFAVFRRSEGIWYIYQSSNNSLRAQRWGVDGDALVPADYDGDGRTDIAIRRNPANANESSQWWILRSGDNGFQVAGWGVASDVPVRGDYDGDGRADLAVCRNGQVWFVLQSETNSVFFYTTAVGGVPTPGDYDGDGKTDVAVISTRKNGSRSWSIRRSTNPAYETVLQFGTINDFPIAIADVP